MPHPFPARRRAAVPLVAGLALAAAAPAAADAASVTFDRACQLVAQPVVATLTGFTPNANVILTADDYGGGIYEIVPTDANGNGSVRFTSPPLGSDQPLSRDLAFRAVDAVDSSIVATGGYRASTGLFTISGRDKPTTAKRTWKISGMSDGRTVYAHFLLRGKLRGTYALGVARGVCGELTARAAAIPLKFKPTGKGRKRKVRIPAGEWKLQLDHSKRYSPSATPRMIGSLTVSGSQRT